MPENTVSDANPDAIRLCRLLRLGFQDAYLDHPPGEVVDETLSDDEAIAECALQDDGKVEPLPRGREAHETAVVGAGDHANLHGAIAVNQEVRLFEGEIGEACKEILLEVLNRRAAEEAAGERAFKHAVLCMARRNSAGIERGEGLGAAGEELRDLVSGHCLCPSRQGHTAVWALMYGVVGVTLEKEQTAGSCCGVPEQLSSLHQIRCNDAGCERFTYRCERSSDLLLATRLLQQAGQTECGS